MGKVNRAQIALSRSDWSDAAVLVRQRDIGRELCAEFVNQVRIHELKLIRNLEANHSLAPKCLWKFSPQPVHMRLLHAEDHVGPAKMTLSDNDAGVRLRAYRTDLVITRPLEKLFSCQAALFVLTADKQKLLGKGRHQTTASIA